MESKLEAFGFDEVHRGVGRTAVVGMLRAGVWNERDQFMQVIKDAAIKLD